MHKLTFMIALVFLLTGCLSTLFQSGKKPGEVYTFAIPEDDVQRMKEETFEKVLHRPHPSKEREMITSLPKDPAKEGESEARKRLRPELSRRFISEDGFPLITFQGGPMSLGETLEFIAGSSGYRVEFEEGINKALPVSTAFTATPLHKVVAALLEPFGYFAVVDSQKRLVKVSLKPEVDVEKDTSASRSSGKEREESPAEPAHKRDPL